MEALARCAELFDWLRSAVAAEGLSKDHVQAALVYFQPNTKGKEAVIAQTIVLPRPERIGEFANALMSLDKPVFLGMLFLQHDAEAAKAGNTEQENVMFGVPFTTKYDAPARLLAARASQQLKGGLRKLVD